MYAAVQQVLSAQSEVQTAQEHHSAEWAQVQVRAVQAEQRQAERRELQTVQARHLLRVQPVLREQSEQSERSAVQTVQGHHLQESVQVPVREQAQVQPAEWQPESHREQNSEQQESRTAPAHHSWEQRASGAASVRHWVQASASVQLRAQAAARQWDAPAGSSACA